MNKTYQITAFISTLFSVFLMSSVALADPANPNGLSHYKIDSSKNLDYSNSYHENEALPGVTAYLSNWTHYQQGYQPNLAELAKYDTVVLTSFGLCGTEVGDPWFTGGVEALKNSCEEYGLEKYELSTTDYYADLQKTFLGFDMSWEDIRWLEPNPNGLLGGLQQLHEAKGTRIGISLFGRALSNVASNAMRPENRDVMINSLVNVIRAYPFIGQLNIDWEYPGIQGAANNQFDAVNDARNFKEFIAQLRNELDHIERHDVRIAITSGAPQDKIDAVDLASLVAAGVDHIHLMSYDFFGQWDTKLNHHTNLYSADGTKWSADVAIQYMIHDLGIPPKNIYLGYVNYTQNAITKGHVEPSPLKGRFVVDWNTAGSFDGATHGIHDIFSNYVDTHSGRPLVGKKGYHLYTDKSANADFLFNAENDLFISLETPRTVFAKSQYVLQHGLGGLFSWMSDFDQGLLLNAAREGLGYAIEEQAFDMTRMIASCGINVTDAEECERLTFDSTSGPNIVLSDQHEAFVLNSLYQLSAVNMGFDITQAKLIQWTLVDAEGLDKTAVSIHNGHHLDVSFDINVEEVPMHDLALSFQLDIDLKSGEHLSGSLTYHLKVSETVPVILALNHSKNYTLGDGQDLVFSVDATDAGDTDLRYSWEVISNNARVNGVTDESALALHADSLLNRSHYEVITRVTVTNKFGNTDSVVATTSVMGDASINTAPVASFDVLNREQLTVGELIELRSTSQDELIDELGYDWSITKDGDPVVIDAAKGVVANFTPEHAGEYQVTLTITDTFDLTSDVVDIIVVSPSDVSIDGASTWESAVHYNAGDVVLHDGIHYTAQWWTQNDEPSYQQVWVAELVDTVKEWQHIDVYDEGDQVLYDGEVYTAQWWTAGERPGSSDAWLL